MKKVQSFRPAYLNCVTSGYQKLQFGSGTKLVVGDGESKSFIPMKWTMFVVNLRGRYLTMWDVKMFHLSETQVESFGDKMTFREIELILKCFSWNIKNFHIFVLKNVKTQKTLASEWVYVVKQLGVWMTVQERWCSDEGLG